MVEKRKPLLRRELKNLQFSHFSPRNPCAFGRKIGKCLPILTCNRVAKVTLMMVDRAKGEVAGKRVPIGNWLHGKQLDGYWLNGNW